MLRSILSYLDIAADIYDNRTVYTDGSDRISFAQLKSAAASIGTAVAAAEKAERPVAVLTGRHVYTPACYLGIAMAGCFYAPMDPGVPDSRLRQILDVAKPDTLIADREHAEKAGELGYTGRIIIMEEAMETAADEAVLAERRSAITETTPLYILFTSGSTGKPKGVLTSHLAVICYLDGLQEVIGLKESDILGNQAPLDYIAAIRDMYLPLMTGAKTVMLHPNEFAMPQNLIGSLQRAGVTTLCWSATGLEIPARLGVFDDAENMPALPPLKRVVFSGSVISNPLLRKWQEAFPDTTFINQYGPTEATGSCTYYVIDHAVQDDEIIPIGKPYNHYMIDLLTEDGRHAEPGETGEICVRGPALALGYYDAPEQTEKNFVLSPAHSHWKEPMYRTGDLGRMGEDGQLYFLGRKDRQFKHLGHRIEPEEIEQKASLLNGVEECVCTYNAERKAIHLFYKGSATPKEISLFLRAELPSFMAPRKLTAMEELPRLPNGKLDRKKLEELTQGR